VMVVLGSAELFCWMYEWVHFYTHSEEVDVVDVK
jgi:hypothetical protein